jgi:hypothetical protein
MMLRLNPNDGLVWLSGKAYDSQVICRLTEVHLAAVLVLKIAIVGLGVFSTVLASILYFGL